MPQAKKNDAVSNQSTEIELSPVKYEVSDLRDIDNFADALELMTAYGIEVDDASTEIGDSFIKLDDKNKLVDVPLLFLSWNFVKGDFSKEFVVARVMAQLDNKTIGKYAIIDGSVGICKDLREYSNAHGGKMGGLKAMGGLSRSDYEVDIPDPKTGELQRTPSTTYYISTNK